MKHPETYKWWFNSFIELAKAKLPSFTIDALNKDVIEALCYYHAQDQRFKGDLQKGICLAGGVGTGKTFTVKIFNSIIRDLYQSRYNENEPKNQFNYRNAIMISTVSVAEAFINDGLPGLYSKVNGPRGTVICYDDLGDEPFESKHMGNTLGVMKTVITNRYDQGPPWNNTHFTTNLNPGQIEEAYGTRIRSRLRQMANFLELCGEDRRK